MAASPWLLPPQFASFSIEYSAQPTLAIEKPSLASRPPTVVAALHEPDIRGATTGAKPRAPEPVSARLAVTTLFSDYVSELPGEDVLFSQVYRDYLLLAKSRDWPEITQHKLSKILKELGCKKYLKAFYKNGKRIKRLTVITFPEREALGP